MSKPVIYKGKLPSYTFTKSGFEKIKEEYDCLLKERPSVLTRVSAMREMGDLSENAGYHAAKQTLRTLDGRMRELKLYLRFGKVVEAKNNDVVSLGCKVLIKDDEDEIEYQIVGPTEADPLNGKVSSSSPIGKALLGKKVGQEALVEAPEGVIKYKVLSIS